MIRQRGENFFCTTGYQPLAKRAWASCPCYILLLCVISSQAFAEQWTSRVRGSWVADENDQNGVVLAAKDSICEIVIDPKEPSNVQVAATFLQGDLEKITGRKPAIVGKGHDDRAQIVLGTAPMDDGNSQKWPWTFGRGDWEAFQIRTGQNAVYLMGSNPRGTAFAVYTLSERLGVDPLYLWTGYRPERHEKLVMKETDYSSGPPTVKYRGMFHDDEDILPRPFEPTGYPNRLGDVPTEWYKKYFETALRLKVNMVAPYTRVHRRHEVQKLASDWGLFYTSHHYDILLSNPFGMTRYGLAEQRQSGTNWNWQENREGLLRYWRGGVEENKDINCIWPVALRGTDDTGYRFAKGTTEA
ncbi:MAG TPA: glycosyl hydrolase 115 family protein, partial [Tepidisphaeraceae bacterium]|nr:glycosyl hydrolase 115 family protein [Tepidisphaeraceae bacterium]